MKKLFFTLAFVAVALTSCFTEGVYPDYEGRGAVDFTLGISVPELEETRAGETGMNSALGAIDNFSDDEWAKYNLRYILEIYDATPGYENYDTPVKSRDINIHDRYEPTKFELRLIPSRTYKFVVWADFVLQTSDDVTKSSKADLNYNTSDLSNITRIKGVQAMDESMDAYFIQTDLTITSSALPKTLELTRPFGKIRVISTDINEINKDTELSKVDVTFYNQPIFSSLNAITGRGENSVETVTYSYPISKDAPYTAGKDAEANMQTIFSDYIFTKPAIEGAQEVNFTMEVTDQLGRRVRKHDFSTQIPLMRNHLTTIIGNLFTTQTKIEITINDNFEDKEHVIDARMPIDTPVLAAEVEGNVVTLSWAAVEGAASYSVVVDNGMPAITDQTTYTFTGDYATEYTFKVAAIPADEDLNSESEAATYIVTTEADPYIYLKPNSNWTQANARFAVYTWSNGDKWVDMKDSDGDGIYEVLKSDVYTNIIFCRMNPGTSTNDWTARWNQTSALTVPTDGKNLYTIAANTWDNGTWSVKK